MPRAGLDAAAVTEAGATLADEIGLDRLSMGAVAERLGVRTPSLYKHVDSLADLVHRIAVLGATEVAASMGDATRGRAGVDALAGAAHSMRDYVRQHPGRYAAGVRARPVGDDDPLIPARDRTLDALGTVLHGYELDEADRIHALRTLRSVLHGFATLEASDSFQMSTDIEESFAWTLDFIDRGLRDRS
ncbi:TetR/AcrR family transcriptional regulator [Clavibacter lycopersici]|uniref:TetR/AcrR family transcriptional regulator n=1 Tax=Clavibacter lycopersici TaxID=2301718 RepID=A0A399SNW8_9MICO|nr:TetR/AcrR family transcriptional regulator [Clavibacter lycopersici]RIJ45370.1 TetR/AcrR family transcriptional regulator [Clavibacter lycopersici]RIJ58149.1 TetR/AcrR family transcriptional regulator [Clavibacter lycopersici]